MRLSTPPAQCDFLPQIRQTNIGAVARVSPKAAPTASLCRSRACEQDESRNDRYGLSGHLNAIAYHCPCAGPLEVGRAAKRHVRFTPKSGHVQCTRSEERR